MEASVEIQLHSADEGLPEMLGGMWTVDPKQLRTATANCLVKRVLPILLRKQAARARHLQK